MYEHVLAWHEALEQVGIALSVWRIHRRIGMSGGLLINALLRETGAEITADLVEDSSVVTQMPTLAVRRRFGRYQAPRSC